MAAVTAHAGGHAPSELAANLQRWLAFLGYQPGEWFELQTLGVTTNWNDVTKFAHVDNAADAARLCAEIERSAMGVFLVANTIADAVSTRAERGRWHVSQRGRGTSDADIVSRRVVLIDVDAVRATGTSSTEAELARARDVAERLHQDLVAILGDGDPSVPWAPAPFGLGHSGGAQVLIALDRIPETPELALLVRGVVNAVAILYSTADVHTDTSVVDAKRLMPAFGTLKRKGAEGIAERPHRRTSFQCVEPTLRLDIETLTALHEELVSKLSREQRAEYDKAMGVRRERSASSPVDPKVSGDSPFKRANERAPVREVLGWLGLLDGDDVRCPGCGTSGDSSVSTVGNGLKCLHARCAQKGNPSNPGFRSVVDLVCEVRGVEPRDAVNELAERFDFEGFTKEPSTGKPDQPVKTDPFDSLFKPVEARALIERPPLRRYLLSRGGAGVVPLSEVGMLLAAGGVGKSMLECQLALCVALGQPFLDTFEVSEPGNVLLAFGEESKEEIDRRLWNAANSLGLSREERELAASRIVAIGLAGMNVQLTSGDGRGNVETTKVLDHLLTHLGRQDVFWSLLVLDPLARFAGNDVEKDSHAATQFIAACERLKSVQGSPSVLLAHHTNKLSRRPDAHAGAEASRGSSGLTDGARWAMSLNPEGDNVAVLSLSKANYSRATEPVYLLRQPEFGGMFRPMGPGELEEHETAGAERKKAEREQAKAQVRSSRFESDVEAVALCLPVAPAFMSRDEILGALARQGRPCSHHTLGTWLAQLMRDGRVVDLSGGARSKARQYALTERTEP